MRYLYHSTFFILIPLGSNAAAAEIDAAELAAYARPEPEIPAHSSDAARTNSAMETDRRLMTGDWSPRGSTITNAGALFTASWPENLK